MKLEQYKQNIRCIGFDDLPFNRNNKHTHILGTIMRASGYIDGFVYKIIEIDGLDSTEKIIKSIESRYKDQLKCIFSHGLTFGGFNVIDSKKIYENLGIPLIAITKKEPNMENVKNALMKHFSDWNLRYYILNIPEKENLKINNGKIFLQYYGISLENAEKLIKMFTKNGTIPEPIRISHLIATSIKFGNSKGF